MEAEPIARSVLIGHLEARHRVLMLLVGGLGIDVEAAVRLNQLRRRVERWTDLLIGYLAGHDDVSEFAIEPERARDFAEDLRSQSQCPGGRQAWPLVVSSLRAAFRRGLEPLSPNADLNARIAASILCCFPADLFDSTGQFRSLWLVRLGNAASDAQGMIEELLSPEPLASGPAGVRVIAAADRPHAAIRGVGNQIDFYGALAAFLILAAGRFQDAAFRSRQAALALAMDLFQDAVELLFAALARVGVRFVRLWGRAAAGCGVRGTMN